MSGNDDEAKFDWDEVTRGHILGAFFYGYLTTQAGTHIYSETHLDGIG